jgi:hypothetical protein
LGKTAALTFSVRVPFTFCTPAVAEPVDRPPIVSSKPAMSKRSLPVPSETRFVSGMTLDPASLNIPPPFSTASWVPPHAFPEFEKIQVPGFN